MFFAVHFFRKNYFSGGSLPSTFDKQNICSVLLENGCSEIGKIEGEVFFPRENFSFPRSDSCQNRAQRGFGSPDRGKEKFSRGKEEPESFYIEENRFSSRQDTFSLLIKLHDPTIRSLAPNQVIYGCPPELDIWTSISFTFIRALQVA